MATHYKRNSLLDLGLSTFAFSASDILGHDGSTGERTTAPAMTRPSLSRPSPRKPKAGGRKSLINSYGLADDDCLGHTR